MRNMLYEREIRAKARAEGFRQGRLETMNTILELMRIHGFSPEEINAVKAAALKIVTGES